MPLLSSFDQTPAKTADDLRREYRWVHALPSTSQVGEDGRLYKISDLQAVLDRTLARSTRVAVDQDHSIARDGGGALGWVAAYEIRDDGLWAAIDWTDRGLEVLASREYRYISPGVMYDPKTGDTLYLFEISLTNLPNLRLSALFDARGGEEAQPKHKEDLRMDLMQQLAELFGLAEGAKPEDILGKARSLLDVATAPVVVAPAAHAADMVPRAEYDRLAVALAEREKADAQARAARYDAMVEAACKEGKIAPAARAYHRAVLDREGGEALFSQFVAAAPSLFSSAAVPSARPQSNGDDERVQYLVKIGMSPEQATKALEAERKVS